MKVLNLLAAVAAASSAAACAVGPDYQGAPQVAGAGAFVSAGSELFTQAEPPAHWWRLYQEPELDLLVAEALANNREVAVAQANLAEVRAVLRETRSAQLPSTLLTGGAARRRQADPLTGEAVEADTTSAGLDVAYEVDLFGRVRRSLEAADAEVGAAEAAVEAVRVSVTAETTRAYADACAFNAQISVAERNLDLLERTAQLTRRQLDAGRGTGLDVARAQAQVQAALAAIPPLHAAREAALFRLSLLVGRPPAEGSQSAASCSSIPDVAAVIPIGDGASLLRRRPDVRQAERRLAAATARIGIATASLYPQVSLGGSISTLGGGGQNFGDDFQFSVGPLIQWSFPNMSAARARIAQADASAEGALAAFEQTNLVALQEAETALSGYARELDRRAALRRARDESARAVQLSRLRQAEGLDSFLTVIDAERTLTTLEAELARSEAAIATQQIAVFKALGGGWQAEAR